MKQKRIFFQDYFETKAYSLGLERDEIFLINRDKKGNRKLQFFEVYESEAIHICYVHFAFF